MFPQLFLMSDVTRNIIVTSFGWLWDELFSKSQKKAKRWIRTTLKEPSIKKPCIRETIKGNERVKLIGFSIFFKSHIKFF